jgi:hypothetical protein
MNDTLWRRLAPRALGLWLLIAAVVSGAVPELFNYQATLREPNGTPMGNKALTIEVKIFNGDGESAPELYAETQDVTTTANGSFTLRIGATGAADKPFSGVNWAGTTPYLRIRFKTKNAADTAYIDFGKSQLLSVPYAHHAKTATKADALTEPRLVPICIASVDTKKDTAAASIAFTAVTPPEVIGSAGLTPTVTWNDVRKAYVIGIPTKTLNLFDFVASVTPIGREPTANGTAPLQRLVAVNGFISGVGGSTLTDSLSVQFTRPGSATEAGRSGFHVVIYEIKK